MANTIDDWKGPDTKAEEPVKEWEDVFFYNKVVLDHFTNPRNIGEMAEGEADGFSIGGDSSCGDQMELWIKVKANKIVDIKFKCFGCPGAIATSSMMTVLARGKTITEAKGLTDDDVIEALGGLPEQKKHCSLLGISALHEAIKDKTQEQMKITIIYDNTTIDEALKKDWGFSCVIEAYQRKILFDAGGNGAVLLHNMKRLEIDPNSITDVFLSHSHFDHIGGLSAFLNKNNNVTIHVPTSLKGIRSVKKVLYYDRPGKIYDHFYTTGELAHLEQSLAVKTEKGLVLITGCSHPGIPDMFKVVSQLGSIYGIVGGLHGFNQLELFRDLELICPCHCTEYKKEINARYPGKSIEGGVGQRIEM